MDVKVGDTFWFVGAQRFNTSGPVTVTKVGRKWCTLSNGHRFDKTDKYWRQVDGGEYSSPGTLYDSEQHYNDRVEFARLVSEIHQKTYGYRIELSSVTLADVRKAAELLGIELSPSSETPR